MVAERVATVERLNGEEDSDSERMKRVRRGEAPSRRPSGVALTAALANRTKRSVETDLKIARELAPDVRERLRGTQTEDNQAELYALACVSAEDQREVLDRALAGTRVTVKAALRALRSKKGSKAQTQSSAVEQGRQERVFANVDDDPADVDARAAKDALLVLKAPGPRLMDGIRFVERAGFTVRDTAVQPDEPQGEGAYLRYEHSIIVVATRGNAPKATRKVGSVIPPGVSVESFAERLFTEAAAPQAEPAADEGSATLH